MKEKYTPLARYEPKYETHKATWEGVDLVIRHCRSWLSATSGVQTQHIEVQSALCTPLPITQTGYRSIFLNGAEALVEYQDDPVNYVLSYIRQEAQSKEWKAQVEKSKQPDLFG